MMDDADESDLAGIDLQMWRVPPPAAVHRASLLVSALSPAAAPARRRRIGWIMAAIVIVNAVLATLVVILLARPPVTQRTVTVQAAGGGGSVDAQVRELLQRLEREQRELERKLAEIQELRALVVELSEKVRKYEQQDGKREHTVPKQRDRVPPLRVEPQPVDPDVGSTPPVDDRSCDEVSCVLTNNDGACCAKFLREPRAAIIRKDPALPDSLDRTSISKAIASVKAGIAACGARWPATGKVKVRVRVSPAGRPVNVDIESTPDPKLAACVASTIQKATFEPTVNGGSFSYPFVFGASP